MKSEKNVRPNKNNAKKAIVLTGFRKKYYSNGLHVGNMVFNCGKWNYEPLPQQ